MVTYIQLSVIQNIDLNQIQLLVVWKSYHVVILDGYAVSYSPWSGWIPNCYIGSQWELVIL